MEVDSGGLPTVLSLLRNHPTIEVGRPFQLILLLDDLELFIVYHRVLLSLHGVDHPLLEDARGIRVEANKGASIDRRVLEEGAIPSILGVSHGVGIVIGEGLALSNLQVALQVNEAYKIFEQLIDHSRV